jgi:transcriptional regulator with XRE-family HTH domain
MLNIGDKIIELRKRNNWSQSELAKAIDVPVDYLLGEGKHSTYDNDTVKRIEEIQVLDGNTKSVLFNLIDTYIRDAKARVAYK